MATLECNNGQDGFSPVENGNALPEEKSLSIDYSEDLWLANSEDSSDPYAQQSSKMVAQEQPGAHPDQAEIHESFQGTSVVQQTIDPHLLETETSAFTEPQAAKPEAQAWNETISEDVGGASSDIAQSTTAQYVNGSVEHNGIEFNSSGEEKDFAQLVPAGSFVEGAAVVGVENQDKTFTSLMPAAALSVNGEIQPGYTTILGSHSEQVVYYSTSDRITTTPSSPMVTPGGLAISYDQSVQMAAVSGEKGEVGEDGSSAVYVSVEDLSAGGGGHIVATAAAGGGGGSFTVLSPALISMTGVKTEEQAFSAHTATGSSYQHISTLPYVQNGAYPVQTSFTSYPATSAGAINNGDSQQQHIIQHSAYSSNGAILAASIHHGAIDYQEEDNDEEDDQDDDTNQDLDDSVEYSEFSCPICSEAFPDQSTLDDHVNNHPPLKTFVCETCGKGFATRRYLKYHRKNHCKRAGSYEGRNDIDENDPNGEVKRFSCNICTRLFRVLKCMKVHKKKKHGILKEYTCQNCAVTYNSSQELVDHPCQPRIVTSTPRVVHYTPPPLALPSQQKKKKKLKQAKPACDICGKTFSDRISVDIHRVKHIEEELYPCDMCDDDEGVDANHLAVHFRIRFFTDDNQHILEDQKAAVATHDRSEDGSSVSATPVHNPGSVTPQSAPATPVYLPATPTHPHPPGTPVSASSMNPSEVAVEMAVQLLEQPTGTIQLLDQSGFVQKYTDFAVSQVEGRTQTFPIASYAICDSHLTAGQSILINQQPEEHQIDLTQQQVYDADYEEGEIIHDASGSVMAVTPKKKKTKQSKVHMCDICNKSFGDTAKLELHYKSNHLHDRPYQCDVCEKSFFTKWKLQRHMLSHLEQKPHSCPMCSKSFVERGKLEAHYRTHLGTKPYKCDQCPKAFTVKSQLSIHQRRIHSTDQPFGCLVCGKAFLWKSGLDKHMRKHTREKPYICETCGMKYSNKANLIVHMSKAHSQAYVDK